MSKKYFISTLLLFIFFSSCNDAVTKRDKKEELTSPKTFDEVSDLLSILQREKEAKEKSDILALAFAYQDKVSYYHLSGNRDSMLYYAHLGDRELNEFKEKTPKLNAEQIESYIVLKKSFASSIIESYLSTNMYDLALMYLQGIAEGEYLDVEDSSLEAQMYYLLGLTYIHSKKAERAMESFRKAYALYQESETKEPYSYYVYFKGMIHARMRQNDLDAMIALSDSVERMIDREQAALGEKDYSYYQIKYAILYEKAGTYVKRGELKKARALLDQARHVFAENLTDVPHKFIHYQIEALYYLTVRDFDQAKEYLEASLEYAKDKEGEIGIYNYLQTNLIKAEIMRQEGRPEEAYELLSELYQLNDSTNTANFSSQVAKIESIYQVDKMKLEGERNKEAIRKMLYLFIGGFMVLVLLIFIVYFYRKTSKTLKEKNRQLFQKLSELEQNNQQIQALKGKDDTRKDVQSAPVDPQESIINSLHTYLMESEEFKNPNLSREDMALAIGTNRQYLIEAIKEKTGKTFNEYIYSYRLKYAFDLIVGDKEKKISDIFLESGFLSNATFYRAFKEKYGMTPSELRNVS